MKKIYFDILMIVLMAVLLLTLDYLELLEESAKFGVVALIAFYGLGQYSQRKFSKK